MIKKVAVVLLCCASWSWAITCPAGYTEYREHCYPEIRPETGPSVQPSDEKPPADKMPSWQREGIQVADDSKLGRGADDINQDKQKTQANAEGQAACEKKYGQGQCGPESSETGKGGK